MDLVRLVTDGYERKARLYPCLVLILPPVASIIGIWSAKLSELQSVATILLGCGISFLLAQLARDAGKKREGELFAAWGGMPSVTIFRHRDNRIDAITKMRYHKTLGTLVKGAKAPSTKEEAADPAAADQIYLAWSTYLRVNTRDHQKYPLLFAENVNYGYRRNLYGLRPWGVAICGFSSAITAFWCIRMFLVSHLVAVEPSLAGLVSLVFLLLWIFRFTAAWARVAAEAYAERLAEAVETLGHKPRNTHKASGT